MIYDIESRADISGATLIIRIPEEDLDRKPLYTIQADLPKFLVPFRYRNVDGQIECIYQLGERSKLQYRFGRRNTSEYIQFWSQLLQPLLDCNDWFCSPFSFVLDTQHIYIDRDNQISYLYVPSKRACVDQAALKNMVVELSQQNSVTDQALENKVLRPLMQDFQPKAFLQMLRQTSPDRAAHPGVAYAAPKPEKAPEQSPAPQPATPIPSAPVELAPKADPIPEPGLDDIVINMNGSKAGKKEKSKGLFGGKKEKKAPKELKLKRAGCLAAKRKRQTRRSCLAAAQVSAQPEIPHRPEIVSAPVWTPPEIESECTQIDEGCQGTYLCLIGDTSLPMKISVDIMPGRSFTIGRYDVSIGYPQSDFEFDKKTKAVSRHHAAIERKSDGSYQVIDLSSSAGTFVNGDRLTPNVGYPLTRGCRVSFGTSGADYIWEE